MDVEIICKDCEKNFIWSSFELVSDKKCDCGSKNITIINLKRDYAKGKWIRC